MPTTHEEGRKSGRLYKQEDLKIYETILCTFMSVGCQLQDPNQSMTPEEVRTEGGYQILYSDREVEFQPSESGKNFPGNSDFLS